MSQALYKRHRQWALSLAEQRGGSDEDRLAALLALARCCHGWTGNAIEFKTYARPEIEAALHRKAVEV